MDIVVLPDPYPGLPSACFAIPQMEKHHIWGRGKAPLCCASPERLPLI
jgi:hypothetical protein